MPATRSACWLNAACTLPMNSPSIISTGRLSCTNALVRNKSRFSESELANDDSLADLRCGGGVPQISGIVVANRLSRNIAQCKSPNIRTQSHQQRNRMRRVVDRRVERRSSSRPRYVTSHSSQICPLLGQVGLLLTGVLAPIQ
jgi:hypothetical protein